MRAAITGPQAADIVGGTPQEFDAFIKRELQALARGGEGRRHQGAVACALSSAR